jgi:outer membrane protein assembly factor BamB
VNRTTCDDTWGSKRGTVRHGLGEVKIDAVGSWSAFGFAMRYVWVAILAFIFIPQIASGQFDELSSGNVLILAPRDYQRQLELTQKAIDAGDYSEAVERLEALLNGRGENATEPLREDFFVGKPDKALLSDSLRAKLYRLQAKLPPAAREAYELHFGADAKRLLEQALEERNVAQLGEVRRRFFATDAGYAATILLGRHLLDSNMPLSAAACFDQLVESPAAVQKFGSELFLLQAYSRWQAGDDAKAEQILKELKDQYPAATFLVRGKTHALWTEQMPALQWLQGVFGPRNGKSPQLLAPVEWLVYRGDAQRNAESSGSMPLLNLRWRVPVADDPADSALINSIVKRAREDHKALIPSLQPIIVHDTVFMRGARQMVAVDLETGKRIYEFPWADPITLDIVESNGANNGRRINELTERVWRNAIHGQLSSNGTSLFLIDELNTDRWAPEALGNVFPQMMGPRFNDPTDDHNVLVALEIATEGKYLWRVGGANGEEEPALAGVFFLGPPIEVEGELFVLGEKNGDTSLYSLDPANGRVRWSQQLAHVDPLNGFIYLNRRSGGAIPSYSDGILVCPTTAGAIVAIDRATRSLLWGYQYFDPAETRDPRIFRRPPIEPAWYDASVTIANGKVIFGAADAGQFYCLDLLSGKLIWKKSDRAGDDLYVACVHQDIVTIVGRRRVVGLKLANGHEAWKLDLATTRTTGLSQLPTGRGFRSQDHYFLPTSNSILKINLLTGNVEGSMATEESLGNLVAYKDQILSLSPEWLTAFYQLDRLSEIVADRLAADPNDPWALEQQGLLYLDQGRRVEGLESLRRSLAAYAPDDPRRDGTRQLLVDGLLTTLEEDYVGHQALIEEVSSLIDRATDKSRLLIVLGNGRLRTGDVPGAFAAFADLVFSRDTSEPGDSLRIVESKARRAVRHDRLIQVGLRDAFETASREQRERMLARLNELKQSVLASGDLAQMLRCIQFFGDHQVLDDVRLRVAERFLFQNQLVHAEQILLPILKSENGQTAASAHVLMARIFDGAGYYVEAANCYRIALGRWPDQALADGRQVRDIVDALDATGQVAQLLRSDTNRAWPFGEAVVTTSTITPRQSIANEASFLTANYQPFVRQQWNGDLSPRLTMYVEKASSIVATDEQGRDRFRLPRQLQNFANNDGEVHTSKSFGSVYVINSGEMLVAVSALDSRGSLESQILWPPNYGEMRVEPSFEPMRPATTVLKNPNRWKQMIAKIGEQKISAFGPLSSKGLVYLQSNKLTCVDLLTGEVLWTRADVQPNCEIWGDERFVFAADALEARVFDMLDGRELEKRSIPMKDRRWEFVDRHILWTHDEADAWTLRLQDPWTGNDVWKRSFSVNSRGFVSAQQYVAIVQQDGACSILDLKTGKALVEDQLELPARDLHCVYLFPSQDQFIVACAYRFRSQSDVVFETINDSTEAIYDALLFAFDRRTGARQWQTPVSVEKFGIPLDQPPEVPTLLFLRKSAQRRTPNPKMDGVCIDRRDGRVLFEARNKPISRMGYRMQGNPQAHKVEIRLATNEIYSITFSDQPRPPEPPARIGSTSGTADGLKRIGKAILGPLFRGRRPATDVRQAPQDAAERIREDDQ